MTNCLSHVTTANSFVTIAVASAVVAMVVVLTNLMKKNSVQSGTIYARLGEIFSPSQYLEQIRILDSQHNVSTREICKY